MNVKKILSLVGLLLVLSLIFLAARSLSAIVAVIMTPIGVILALIGLQLLVFLVRTLMINLIR